MKTSADTIQVRTVWTGVESAHALHANQAIAQIGPSQSDGRPDGIFLTFGSAANPALMGDADPEGTREAIERIKAEGVKVNILGQFHISRSLVNDVIKALRTVAEMYDAVEAAGTHAVSPEGGA